MATTPDSPAPSATLPELKNYLKRRRDELDEATAAVSEAKESRKNARRRVECIEELLVKRESQEFVNVFVEDKMLPTGEYDEYVNGWVPAGMNAVLIPVNVLFKLEWPCVGRSKYHDERECKPEHAEFTEGPTVKPDPPKDGFITFYVRDELLKMEDLQELIIAALPSWTRIQEAAVECVPSPSHLAKNYFNGAELEYGDWDDDPSHFHDKTESDTVCAFYIAPQALKGGFPDVRVVHADDVAHRLWINDNDLLGSSSCAEFSDVRIKLSDLHTAGKFLDFPALPSK